MNAKIADLFNRRTSIIEGHGDHITTTIGTLNTKQSKRFQHLHKLLFS